MKILLLSGLLIAGLACSAQAEGDPAKEKKVFKKCAACHAITEGKKKVGSSMFSVGSGPPVRLKVSNTPNPWPRPDTPGTRNIL